MNLYNRNTSPILTAIADMKGQFGASHGSASLSDPSFTKFQVLIYVY